MPIQLGLFWKAKNPSQSRLLSRNLNGGVTRSLMSKTQLGSRKLIIRRPSRINHRRTPRAAPPCCDTPRNNRLRQCEKSGIAVTSRPTCWKPEWTIVVSCSSETETRRAIKRSNSAVFKKRFSVVAPDNSLAPSREGRSFTNHCSAYLNPGKSVSGSNHSPISPRTVEFTAASPRILTELSNRGASLTGFTSTGMENKIDCGVCDLEPRMTSPSPLASEKGGKGNIQIVVIKRRPPRRPSRSPHPNSPARPRHATPAFLG